MTSVGHTVGGPADGGPEVGVAQGLSDAVFVGSVEIYLHGGDFLLAGWTPAAGDLCAVTMVDRFRAGAVIRPSDGGDPLGRVAALTA
ncbi:MAG: hypothetical protein OXC27_19775 [Caldilineaceae bacterium]|nr:hypothetical protein [Caldilineaceae bacterium]